MIKTVKMKNLSFDESLFIPMRTGKKIDQLFSSEGGLMRGTNYAIVGGPGAGKSTLTLDYLSDLMMKGLRVLFVSAEMNEIDMYPYVRRYPKFGELDIVFAKHHLEDNFEEVLIEAFKPGYDVILMDSMAEVCTMVQDTAPKNMTKKRAESLVLNLLEDHNTAKNDNKVNTAFLVIQQMTKQGNFSGSNRFKHMLNGMCHVILGQGGRYIHYSKNRRGGDGGALWFNLNTANNVDYMYWTPIGEE
jgi:predicted ATP-dependent serine protease